MRDEGELEGLADTRIKPSKARRSAWPRPPEGHKLERVGKWLHDRFEVREALAKGGQGSVHIAHDHQLGRDVAVKFLNIPPLEEPATDDQRARWEADAHELERRFQTEVKTIAALEDVRILKALAWGRTDDGGLFMATELLKGMPLSAAVKSEQRLAEQRVVRILIDVCAALAEAHAAGVIHRDIKPANIFLQRTRSELETARVLDFGIAKLTDPNFVALESAPATATGLLVGTPLYMSPEQLGSEPLTPLSDIYSLGVVAYECLSGSPPFSGAPVAILRAQLTQKPDPLTQTVPGLSIHPRLERLVFQMLSTAPGERPQGAASLRNELESIQAELQHDEPGGDVAWDQEEVFPPTATVTKRKADQPTPKGAEPAMSGEDLRHENPPSDALLELNPTAPQPRPRRIPLALGLGLLTASAVAIAVTRGQRPAPVEAEALVAVPPELAPLPEDDPRTPQLYEEFRSTPARFASEMRKRFEASKDPAFGFNWAAAALASGACDEARQALDSLSQHCVGAGCSLADRTRSVEQEAQSRCYGTIRLSVSPESALVAAGGRTSSGRSTLRLPPGQHELTISAPGYATAHRTVELTVGMDTELNVRLKRKVSGRRPTNKPSISNERATNIVTTPQTARALQRLRVSAKRCYVRESYEGSTSITVTFAAGAAPRTIVSKNSGAGAARDLQACLQKEIQHLSVEVNGGLGMMSFTLRD